MNAVGKQAPVFSPKVLQGTGVVGGSFSEWVHHYNGCAECQRDDWYDPVNAAKLFCSEGRHLFASWKRATASSHRIY